MMQGMMGMHNGLPVHVSPHAMTRSQFRFPRSKKKRIRKKFAKNQDNYRSKPGMFMAGGRLIVHPKYYEELKRLDNG